MNIEASVWIGDGAPEAGRHQPFVCLEAKEPVPVPRGGFADLSLPGLWECAWEMGQEEDAFVPWACGLW